MIFLASGKRRAVGFEWCYEQPLQNPLFHYTGPILLEQTEHVKCCKWRKVSCFVWDKFCKAGIAGCSISFVPNTVSVLSNLDGNSLFQMFSRWKGGEYSQETGYFYYHKLLGNPGTPPLPLTDTTTAAGVRKSGGLLSTQM